MCTGVVYLMDIIAVSLIDIIFPQDCGMYCM